MVVVGEFHQDLALYASCFGTCLEGWIAEEVIHKIVS